MSTGRSAPTAATGPGPAGSAGPAAAAEAPAAVEVVGLSRVFAGPPEVAAVRDATFRIEAGEYAALTGASGSGKTTLLSLLGLLDTPTSGTYLLNGDDVSELGDGERAAVRAHQIGFVFQAFHLVGYRSVADNVELGLTYQGVPRRERRRLVGGVIEQVGLGHRAGALCATLSGGEKQRVAIARTLIRRPALVLCDEPTGNLDSATSAQILDHIEQLHRDGLTVMMITHDPAVAARAQRHLTIADGLLTESSRGARPVGPVGPVGS